jgi:hypothetical protein
MTEKLTAQQIADGLIKNDSNKKISVVDVSKEKIKEAKLKQSPPIKAKFYYDVKVECMLPATLTYRVLAEDPQQAADLIKGMSPVGVKHRIIGKKDIKLSVYKAGSSMLEFVKNLLGR